MTSVIVKTIDMKPAPCEIQYKNVRFLITDRPSNQTIQRYINELKKHDVKAVVRVCEPTYGLEPFQAHDIKVYDMEYDDGSSPPDELLEEWFKLLKEFFEEHEGSCIAVHCVAGLGRAPVMVACTFIEMGMKYEDAVELIRSKRRGAINSKQLAYLEKYRPKNRFKMKSGHKNSCCLQ